MTPVSHGKPCAGNPHARFDEGASASEELRRKALLHHILQTNTKGRPEVVYNLEVVTSVGYRVKSLRGVLFRRWANRVLKEYLLRGYSVNVHLNQLEDKMDRRLAQHDQAIVDLKERADFFVQTQIPPIQNLHNIKPRRRSWT